MRNHCTSNFFNFNRYTDDTLKQLEALTKQWYETHTLYFGISQAAFYQTSGETSAMCQETKKYNQLNITDRKNG